MINEDYMNFLINYEYLKDSLKNASKDTSKDDDNKYMTYSDINVINLDDLKNEFIKIKNIQTGEIETRQNIDSCDCLYIHENTLFCIEFKNGKLSNEDFKEIKLKMYHTILMLSYYTDKSILNFRKNFIFILVFNEENEHKSGKFTNEFKKFHEDAINSKITLKKVLENKSEKFFTYSEFVMFKNTFIKDAIVLTKKQFERSFVQKYEKYDMFEFLTQ